MSLRPRRNKNRPQVDTDAPFDFKLGSLMADEHDLDRDEVVFLINKWLTGDNEIIQGHLKTALITTKIVYSDALAERRQKIRDAEEASRRQIEMQAKNIAARQIQVDRMVAQSKVAREAALVEAAARVHSIIKRFEEGVEDMTTDDHTVRLVLNKLTWATHVSMQHRKWLRFVHAFEQSDMTADIAMSKIDRSTLVSLIGDLGIKLPEIYEEPFRGFY